MKVSNIDIIIDFIQVNASQISIIIIDLALKHVLFNEIIVYDEFDVANKIVEIINVYSII